MKYNPHDYQSYAAGYIESHPISAILLSMGLGKTSITRPPSITCFLIVSMSIRCLSYVEAKDTREKIDIVKLNAEIEKIVAREQVLRDEIDKIVAEIEAK